MLRVLSNFRRARARLISNEHCHVVGRRARPIWAALVLIAASAMVATGLASLALAHGHRHRAARGACGHFHARSSAFTGARHHVRFGSVSNSFGRDMFGIAAGGSIQNDGRRTLAAELGADRRVHAKWIRIDIDWSAIQNGGRSSYSWRATDRVVRDAEACGMKVLGTILYTPWWARPAGTSVVYGPNPTLYARFAAAVAAHYSRLGVYAYEIWNEPNWSVFWQPHPDPAWYTAVLKAAYVAIKAVDPWTLVLTGGTAPAPTRNGDYSPADFLEGVYASGGKGYFDAVGHHPYCWPAFPGARRPWSAWYQMYGTHPSLRSVMIANGDGAKKIWATEFGAPTNGPRGTFVSERTQAKMVIAAYRRFAHYSWAGPLFLFQGRDSGTNTNTYQDFFGFLTHGMRPKPSYAAYLSAANALHLH